MLPYLTTVISYGRPRQNIVVYARKLTYYDEDRIMQKRVAVIMANYALTIAIFHKRHTHMCLKILTLLIFLPDRRRHGEQHV